MDPKRKKRDKASGERAVEKPLRGKVQTQDFSTSLGNPHNPRISTFPQPRRRRVFIFYLEDWRTKNQTPTSADINLSQEKNGLDNGVHLIPRGAIRPMLAAEHLAEEDGITINHETLRGWMLAEGLWSRAEACCWFAGNNSAVRPSCRKNNLCPTPQSGAVRNSSAPATPWLMPSASPEPI